MPLSVPSVIHILLEASDQGWVWEKHSDCGRKEGPGGQKNDRVGVRQE